MTELEAFKYFKDNQLKTVEYSTGKLSVMAYRANQYGGSMCHLKDVGSKNSDGYTRVWCGDPKNKKLCFRHRLVYWLYHGSIPESLEIDHKNRQRSDDSITNLRAVTRKQNCSNTVHTVKKYTYPRSKIEEVCKLLQDTLLSDVIIANRTGLSRNYVRDIKKRRRQVKVSVDYQWKHRDK